MSYITLTSGLTIKVPTRGTRNWADTLLTDLFTAISAHDHTGSGKGLQIGTNALSAKAVSLAKMADIATDSLIGRDTAGTGVPEVLSVGGGLEFTGSGGIQRSALTGDVSASAGSNSLAIGATKVVKAMLNSDIYDGNAVSDLVTIDKLQLSSYIFGGTSGGSANAQTLTCSPAISAYSTGQIFVFTAGFTSTATNPTLNVNGKGALTIFRSDGQALFTGDITTAQIYVVVYNGATFTLLNPSHATASWSPTLGVSSGSLSGTSSSCVYTKGIGKRIHMSGIITATMSVGANYISFTLPETASSANNSLFVSVVDSGTPRNGHGYFADANTVQIWRDGSTWTGSVSNTYRFSGSYLSAA